MDCVFKDAIFSDERTMSSTRRELRFHPSATGYTATTNEVYFAYWNENARPLRKEMPIEALRYYTASIFWLRVIGLKRALGDGFTLAELMVEDAFHTKLLTVPEPIYLALKGLGRFKTKTGEVLAPDFPELATQVVAGIPGTYGIVSADNHNWYEDYPIIGPTYQGLVQRATTPDHVVYASAVAPAGTTANENLQGYEHLQTVNSEVLTWLSQSGIKQKGFWTIANSGISYNVLKCISNYIENFKTFRTYTINLLNLPETGSVAQQIEARPVPEDFEPDVVTIAADCSVAMQSMTREAAVLAGVSQIFGYNQWKYTPEAGTPTERVRQWSGITFTAAVTPTPEWIANANQFRDLPDRYHARTFVAYSDISIAYRKFVITNLTHTGGDKAAR